MWKTVLKVDRLIDAIDAYIRKSDEDLEEQLTAEGYVAVDAAVATINLIEDAVRDALDGHTDRFLAQMKEADSVGRFIAEAWPGIKSEKELRDALEGILRQQFQSLMGECVQEFLLDADKALAIDRRITKPTQDFIESWSSQLADIMHLNTNRQIEEILLDSQEKALSIAQVADAIGKSGIRSPGWRARRVAQTEVLRIESYAQLEYMRQDPSVEEKEWVHTGGHKNKPRANHVAMNGQRVAVEEGFELKCVDRETRNPMCPRDIRLPASETVNCHCIMRPIRNKEIMGMSVEERRALREKYMDEVDAEWDAAHATDKIDILKSMKREDQIKYFGGQDGGRQRMALIDSGVISTDKELERLYKIDAGGKRVRKSLQELAEDGIFTISDDILEHSVGGTFISSSKQYPNGRMASGGHAQLAMQNCNTKGITYSVEKTFSNGVRIGNVPTSKLKIKQSGNGQAWFPEDWDENKILEAGTAIANDGQLLIDGYRKTGIYDGVAVRVLMDNGRVSTICPDLDQNLYVLGVVEND